MKAASPFTSPPCASALQARGQGSLQRLRADRQCTDRCEAVALRQARGCRWRWSRQWPAMADPGMATPSRGLIASSGAITTSWPMASSLRLQRPRILLGPGDGDPHQKAMRLPPSAFTCSPASRPMRSASAGEPSRVVSKQCTPSSVSAWPRNFTLAVLDHRVAGKRRAAGAVKCGEEGALAIDRNGGRLVVDGGQHARASRHRPPASRCRCSPAPRRAA